jgi:hypothetical protein
MLDMIFQVYLSQKRSQGRRNPRGVGLFSFERFEDNHVVVPGREQALHDFLHQGFKGMQRSAWEHAMAASQSRFDLRALPASRKDTDTSTVRGVALTALTYDP